MPASQAALAPSGLSPVSRSQAKPPAAIAFTPGPWDFERGGDSHPRPWIGRLEDHAYSALACGETHEEAMANARLIAAAPELYEALDALLKGCRIIAEKSGINIEAECLAFADSPFAKARRALAKARGEPA